jgi:hypothetical protein
MFDKYEEARGEKVLYGPTEGKAKTSKCRPERSQIAREVFSEEHSYNILA